MISYLTQVQEATDHVFTQSSLRPSVGIVLGTGLGGIVDEMTDTEAIPYAVLPHFPQPTVAGHPGEMVLGRLGDKTLAVLRGRVHIYEGYSPSETAFPVRLLRALGCDTLIVTNAAGGLAPSLAVGDLMLIRDHVFLPGLAGASPLVGQADPQMGPRFVDMALAYDPRLRELAHAIASKQGLLLQEGTYVMVAGPNYETPAELLFLRSLGADAVGMSTCPEVIVARQGGMRVLGISVISNPALGSAHEKISHAHVLSVAESAAPRLVSLIAGVVQELNP